MEDTQKTEALEHELRRRLAHVPAPDGFTDRVMERVTARQKRTAARTSRRGTLLEMPARSWWTAAAAALVLTVGGGDALHVRHVHQEQKAAAVQAQMDWAMQLTNHALAEVNTGFDRSPAGRYAQLWNGPGR